MQKYLKILLILSFTTILLLGFTETANMVIGNWYQQFMPNLNGRPISDITFLDSLTGYAVTPYTANDTAYIIKTSNGGNNWNVIYSGSTNTIGGYNKIQFINSNTGFVCGNFFWKTTNSGINWFNVNTSGIFPMNMYVLNNDTIWLIDSDQLVGGVFRTTNGGTNWTQQLGLGSSNPDHIYMFNARIGFITDNTGSYLRKTTNSGVSWSVIPGQNGFKDIFFTDSLKGWKAFDSVRMTTNGGVNWITQLLPYGGGLNLSQIVKFSYINQDTIWGVGGYKIFPNSQLRGVLYRTTNGGANWLFQIPDTSIHASDYSNIQFINKNTGWANTGYIEIHTTNGGDPVWLTGIKQISSNVPSSYRLYQNYPNPFNPTTNIRYAIMSNVKGQMSNVKLIIYDITGREVIALVNQQQRAGTYQVDFSGNNYSSGVYFYQLAIDNNIIDTKKMMLLK